MFYYSVVNLLRIVIHYSKYSKSVQNVVIHYIFSSKSLPVVNSLQIVNSLRVLFLVCWGPLDCPTKHVPRGNHDGFGGSSARGSFGRDGYPLKLNPPLPPS